MRFPRTIYNEEHLMFRDMVVDFIAKEIAPYHAQWEKDKIMPREVWTKAGAQGLLAMQVPEQYGGLGIDDYRFNAIVTEELGRSGFTGPGIGFQVHSDIAVPYLVKYGNEEIKQAYLPGMVTGELISAICMSEPNAGSDLQRIRTTAVDHGDHYVVSGSKTFISNGNLCDVGVVAVKTDPTQGAKGTSLLVIDMRSEGVSKGVPFEKIGMHAQDTSEIFFDGVKVPRQNLLGGVGRGFGYMMEELPQERLVVALAGVAAAEGALAETVQYVKDRSAFGKRIAEFQNTRYKLAEMTTEVEMARIFMDRCVELHDAGELDAAMASAAKYAMTDLQGKIIDECVQLHGGYGFMWEYYVARAYADARAQRIYAGTNEIMKELIARSVLR